LFGYGLLVEDALGKPVSDGVLRYSDLEVRIDVTPERRQWIAGILAEICGARSNGSLAHNHNSPARCRHCSLRGSCHVALP
jgi:CRISPR/Cas system-associated exonuclease Cas4 (RecB family)